MKLLSSSIFLAVVLLAAPALAADHLIRVSEVLLSGSANSASQYVELSEPGAGEQFQANGYSFLIYDSTGTSISNQPVAISGTTTRIIMANSAAQTEYSLAPGVNNGVIILNMQNTLPAIGSVCFRRLETNPTGGTSSDNAGTRIHCMGWGAATSFPISSGGTDHGDAPAAGMSLQKLAGCAKVGTPSPNAANTGTCPLQPDGAPMTPDAGPGPDAGGGDDDGNPETGSKDDGCSVGVGPGWLGAVGIAGLLIAGGALRRRKR